MHRTSVPVQGGGPSCRGAPWHRVHPWGSPQQLGTAEVVPKPNIPFTMLSVTGCIAACQDAHKNHLW